MSADDLLSMAPLQPCKLCGLAAAMQAAVKADCFLMYG
jgi:hypothetical protein